MKCLSVFVLLCGVTFLEVQAQPKGKAHGHYKKPKAHPAPFVIVPAPVIVKPVPVVVVPAPVVVMKSPAHRGSPKKVKVWVNGYWAGGLIWIPGHYEFR